jgi:hypothetical protein
MLLVVSLADAQLETRPPQRFPYIQTNRIESFDAVRPVMFTDSTQFWYFMELLGANQPYVPTVNGVRIYYDTVSHRLKARFPWGGTDRILDSLGSTGSTPDSVRASHIADTAKRAGIATFADSARAAFIADTAKRAGIASYADSSRASRIADSAKRVPTRGIDTLNGVTRARQFLKVTNTTSLSLTAPSWTDSNTSTGVHTLNIPNAQAGGTGMVSDGTQSMSGQKTWTGLQILQNGLTVSGNFTKLLNTLYLNFTVGGATSVNIGSSGQNVFEATPTSGTATYTLPAANAQSSIGGEPIWVIRGHAATQNVIIQRAGSDLINNSTSFTLTNAYDYLVMVSNGGTRWYIIGGQIGGTSYPGGGGGGGEANTASNLGGGLDNFSAKVGVDLQFNSFSATDFNLGSNLITIDDGSWTSQAEYNADSVKNIPGTGVALRKIATRDSVKRLVSEDANITITDRTDSVGFDFSNTPTFTSETLTGLTDNSALYSLSDVVTSVPLNSTAGNEFLRQVSSGAPTFEPVDYTDLANVPATFPPGAHTHPQTEVDFLADSLATRSYLGHTHPQTEVDFLADSLATRSYTDHTHSQKDVDSLQQDDSPQFTGVRLSGLTADRAVVTNGTKDLASSATTATEIGYVSGVSSAIQTQLNAKQATITGGATTITTADLTADRALRSSATGKVEVSPGVSATELEYLATTTSDVQTQLNGKQPLDGDLTTIAGLTATTDNFMTAVASAWASRTPSQVRTTLALVPGTDVEVHDADLTTIAGLTATTDNFIVAVASAWASRTVAQVKVTLALNNVTNESKATMFTSPTFTGTVTIPSPFTLGSTSVTTDGTELNYVDGVTSSIQTQLDGKQPLDADLTTIAGLTATSNNFMMGVSSAWASTTPADARTALSVPFFNSTDPGAAELFPLWDDAANEVDWRTQGSYRIALSLGNVENTALSTWAGSTNITTLGTISTGTWAGTVIGTDHGGTGLTTNVLNELLVGDGTGTDMRRITAASSAGQVLRSSSPPSWGKVALAGVSDVSGILPGDNGGTGNGFMSFTGPLVAPKVFTLPNASATILTDNTVVTVPQGGTGLATLTDNAILIGDGTNAMSEVSSFTNDGTTFNIPQKITGGSPAVAANIHWDGQDVSFQRHTADAFGQYLVLVKSRGTHASPTATSNSDLIGSFRQDFYSSTNVYRAGFQFASTLTDNSNGVEDVKGAIAVMTAGTLSDVMFFETNKIGIGTNIGTGVLKVQAADNGVPLELKINATSANITAADDFIDFTNSSDAVIGAVEGTASSGVLVYTTFTGGHYAQKSTEAEAMVEGLIVSATGELMVNRQHLPNITKSTGRADKRVYGIYAGKVADGVTNATKDSVIAMKALKNQIDSLTALKDSTLTEQIAGMQQQLKEMQAALPLGKLSLGYDGTDSRKDLFQVFALGVGYVLVTESGGNVAVGDFIQTSPTRGLGEKQPDDVEHSYTVAKATEAVDWTTVPINPTYGVKVKKIACVYQL